MSSNESNNVPALSFTPLLAPNAVFLTIFVILLVLHIILAMRWYRYYGYMMGMLAGLFLEMLGYVAKVMLAHDHANKDGYIMYIIGLTLGPTFLSSSLYLGAASLQKQYGRGPFGKAHPHLFTTFFILGDFLCLCFIGVGGSLAAIFAPQPIGVDLMLAGLGTQVLFTALFCLAMVILYRRLHEEMVVDGRIRYMISAAVATLCLFLRSCWRVAELSGGFNGVLASKEGLFIALDSIPMVIMALLLTVQHPVLWFRDRSHGKLRMYDDGAIGLVFPGRDPRATHEGTVAGKWSRS